MERVYLFSPELLKMMLSEERQKFVSALDQGAAWRELNRIRKTINQLNKLLDSSNDINTDNYSNSRFTDKGPR